MRPANVRLFVAQRQPMDGLFVMQRGRLHPTRPVLHCHVCDSPLEHGDFCPWPPCGPQGQGVLTPMMLCADCYWEALEIAGIIGPALSRQQARIWRTDGPFRFH